jgi:hypothetical protein
LQSLNTAITFGGDELVSEIKRRIIWSMPENKSEPDLSLTILSKGKVLLDDLTLDQVLEDGMIGNAKFYSRSKKKNNPTASYLIARIQWIAYNFIRGLNTQSLTT